ncbi:MAG: hypothetical protein QOJ62_533 [Actinomycetota bacterium]|nr:hypothetical protein [Actinomycetota bacterium]
MSFAFPVPQRRAARRGVLALLGAVAATVGLVVVPNTANADAGGSLVSATNAARAASGLGALTVSADLTAAASRQAATMARTRVLQHTPGLSQAVCCWASLGENVGFAGSSAKVHSAFMASPPHRANILGAAYTQIGIGVAVDSTGLVWVSEIFRRPTAAKPPAPPAPVRPAPVAPARPPAPVQHVSPSAGLLVHAQPPPARVPVVAAPKVPPAAAQAPQAASRGLSRAPLDVANRFAVQFGTGRGVIGTNPVSRLLDFAVRAAATMPS